MRKVCLSQGKYILRQIINLSEKALVILTVSRSDLSLYTVWSKNSVINTFCGTGVKHDDHLPCVYTFTT